MDTNPMTGSAHADDFDVCCGTGFYRRHVEAPTPTHAKSGSTTTYDAVRPAYAFGHRAASNPSYVGRSFEEVEADLRQEYEKEESTFEPVRDHVRQGFEWKTILGSLALAAGGWWAGKKVYEAISEMKEEDEQDSRTYYEAHPARSSGLTYERARTGYALGYAASRNPDYKGRSFDDVEPHLRTGFQGPAAAHGDALRDFARRGYERGSTRVVASPS